MTLPALAQRVLDHIDADELVEVYRPAHEADPVKVKPPAAAIRLYALTALELCSQDRSA